jgi:hypothetical protein
MAAEAAASQATLEPPAEAGPSGGDVVMVSGEDPAPPPSSGSHDVVMIPTSEPTPAVAAADSFAAAMVPEPSPVAEVPGPFPTAEVAETSSVRGAVTVEEVMELATCRYIDFPGVGVIDIEVPQLPEKVLEVATERMFSEPSIMETIALVSKALHEYDHAGGYTPVVAAKAMDAALKAPVASMEPTADTSVPLLASESREASLPQSAEAVEATAVVAVTGTAETVVREAGSSLHRPVATDADEVHALDEPVVAAQERAAPEGTARAASPEIKEVEETGASLSQGAGTGEARALELAYTPWAATIGSGDDSEEDKEVVARNTLECGLNWARRAFDELILPATSLSFLVQRSSSRFCSLLGACHLPLLC